MAGTKAGGQKTRDKNLARDPDWYRKIGTLGGQRGHTGGFASEKVGKDGLTGFERARTAGVIGGKKSKRGRTKKYED